MDEKGEAHHIVVNSNGVPFISTGNGYFLERTGKDSWKNHGRKLHVHSRMQPELGIDEQDNVYMTSWGGRYNILYKDMWMGEKKIDPITENSYVGFVETAGVKDYAYIVWEEGNENDADRGMDEDSKIVVGILYSDGRLIGLY